MRGVFLFYLLATVSGAGFAACLECQYNAYYYKTTANTLHDGDNCSGGSTLDNEPCRSTSELSGCPSVCSGCSYFKTGGGGVLSCYSNAACGVSCGGVDELGAPSTEKPWLKSLPLIAILEALAAVALLFFLLKLRRKQP